MRVQPEPPFMLYDRGLASQEDKTRIELNINNRLTSKYTFCIGERICENCNHIISDSICLCMGYFICPNCQFENGQEVKKFITKNIGCDTNS